MPHAGPNQPASTLTPRRCLAAAGLALGTVLAATPAGSADFRTEGTPVEVAVYDFEVASLCGLVSERVQRGFHSYLEDLVDEAGMDRATFELARMRGWTAADREWANRGLGGFRGWCSGEGAEAAAAFAQHAPEQP